jgi:hypothetical protein
MTPQQKTFTTSQIIKLTGYSKQRLSQLRKLGFIGEKGKDWYYDAGTSYFTETALMRLLEHKTNAARKKGGRPRKIEEDEKTS